MAEDTEGGQTGILTVPHIDAMQIPDDYAEQVAGRIVIIHEKEIDPSISSRNIAKTIYEMTHAEHLYPYFIDATEILNEDDATIRYSAVAWAALIMHLETFPELQDYLEGLAHHILLEYSSIGKPEVEWNHKRYSGFSVILGSVFIRMIEISSSLYDPIQEIYILLMRKETQLEDQEKGQKQKDKSTVFSKKSHKKHTVSKKFYDDIIDYVAARGVYKSTSLNQENPYEHIANLAEQMRGTRRYMIQDIMNRRAFERKKRLEKELSERTASAEEIILANDPFQAGLSLFWREKRYNYKFLAVEKIRVALQIFAALSGLLFLMAGYLGFKGVYYLDGVAVCLCMWIFAKFIGSRKNFKTFYPHDVSKELESHVSQFNDAFKRMSPEQCSSFFMRQARLKKNEGVLQAIPEFVKYLYAVMPDRKNMIVTTDELAELMESLEIYLAKQMRSKLT